MAVISAVIIKRKTKEQLYAGSHSPAVKVFVQLLAVFCMSVSYGQHMEISFGGLSGSFSEGILSGGFVLDSYTATLSIRRKLAANSVKLGK